MKVSMIKYLTNLLQEFPEELGDSTASPAAAHLFQVREDVAKLSEEQAQIFHHTTAQLLFLSSRARRDIQLAVAFLTTRGSNHQMTTIGASSRGFLNISREPGT